MVTRMATPETLQKVVATLLQREPYEVHANLNFSDVGLQGSLARTRLYTVIAQQCGVACQAAYTARTYGELHVAIYGTEPVVAAVQLPAPVSPRTPDQHVQHNGATPGVACGIDIEMVASLPIVADYWHDAFYSATFTSAEIAYCLLQDQPLIHFAARWCAKEALKKCDLVYLNADLRTLEVVLNASGAPCLCTVADGRRTPLPFAVSLSHTSQVAVAVVVKVLIHPVVTSPVMPAYLSAATTPLPAASVDIKSRWSGIWLPVLMGSSALGVALWALVRTW